MSRIRNVSALRRFILYECFLAVAVVVATATSAVTRPRTTSTRRPRDSERCDGNKSAGSRLATGRHSGALSEQRSRLMFTTSPCNLRQLILQPAINIIVMNHVVTRNCAELIDGRRHTVHQDVANTYLMYS